MLAALRDGGARAVALEASSHALASGRTDALALDVAVLTNLGRDHLDFHGDLASYRRAKASLFERRPLGAVVLNGDDELGRELAASVAPGHAPRPRIVPRVGPPGPPPNLPSSSSIRAAASGRAARARSASPRTASARRRRGCPSPSSTAPRATPSRAP